MKNKIRDAFLAAVAIFWVGLFFLSFLLNLSSVLERFVWPNPVFNFRGDLLSNFMLAFLVQAVVSLLTFMLYAILGDTLLGLYNGWLTFIHLLLYASVFWPIIDMEIFLAQTNHEFLVWMDQRERIYYYGVRLLWVVVAAILNTITMRLVKYCSVRFFEMKAKGRLCSAFFVSMAGFYVGTLSGVLLVVLTFIENVFQHNGDFFYLVVDLWMTGIVSFVLSLAVNLLASIVLFALYFIFSESLFTLSENLVFFMYFLIYFSVSLALQKLDLWPLRYHWITDLFWLAFLSFLHVKVRKVGRRG